MRHFNKVEFHLKNLLKGDPLALEKFTMPRECLRGSCIFLMKLARRNLFLIQMIYFYKKKIPLTVAIREFHHRLRNSHHQIDHNLV